MTIKQKEEKLFQSFRDAWEQYKKIETEHATSAGFTELLSVPALKNAYQKWQFAVSDYYDFARSVEHKRLSDELTGT
jgi:hypothetical protein